MKIAEGMMIVSVSGLLLFGGRAMSQPVESAGPKVLSVRLGKQEVAQYERLDVQIELSATYSNPYDSSEIALDVEVTPPSGVAFRIPAFWCEEYALTDDGPKATGKKDWRARISPLEQGDHRACVLATDRHGKTKSEPLRFTATPGKDKGFIRVGKDKTYLRFQSGEPFIPLGINLRDPSNPIHRPDLPLPKDRVKRFTEDLRQLADNGGNCVRFLLVPSYFGFEGGIIPVQEFQGYKRFNQHVCYELDEIISRCEGLGIYVRPTFYVGEDYRPEADEWQTKNWAIRDPYLASQGGPLHGLQDLPRFWTDPGAKEAVKNRMRYAMARWGCSTHVAVWELVNELSLRDAAPQCTIFWVREMASFLRALDPYNRPITTSTSGIWDVDYLTFEKGLFSLDDISLVDIHQYSWGDLGRLAEVSSELRKRYNKPVLFGEFGTWYGGWAEIPKKGEKNWGKMFSQYRGFDLEGLHVHNGLWASLAAGACGAAQLWGWDYNRAVEGKGKYSALKHFEPISKFLKEVRFGGDKAQPLTVRELTPAATQAESKPYSLFIAALKRDEFQYYPLSARTILVQPHENLYAISRGTDAIAVSSNGHVDPLPQVGGYLLANNDPRLGNAVTFATESQHSWRFGLFIKAVTGGEGEGARIRLCVDGKLAQEREFRAGSKEGREREYLSQWKVWRCEYGEDVRLEVPSGKHLIKVENCGRGRAQVGFRFDDYLNPESFVPLRIVGLRLDDDRAFVWIQNFQSNWVCAGWNITPESSGPALLRLASLANGDYRLRWYDTWKGEWISQENAKVTDSTIAINLPPVVRDVALWMEKQ